MIVPARIETAQLGFLRPVFGKLYDKLGEEPYAAFCRTYIKPALAYYVRYLMVDEQCAAIGAAGVRQNKSAYTEAVPWTAGCTDLRQAGAQRCRHAAGQGDRLRGKQSGDVPGIRPERKYPPPGLDKRRIHSVKTPHMKQMIGTISSVAALFAPVQPLVCCALAFVCVDFATGVAASYKRAGRMKRPWAFESDQGMENRLQAGLRHGRHRDDVADRHLHPPVRRAAPGQPVHRIRLRRGSCGATWRMQPKYRNTRYSGN